MLRSNIRIFAYLGRHKKPIYINELKTYYAMPFAHRVKPWRFNDKVLSFEDGIWLSFSLYALVVAILFAILFKHKHDPGAVNNIQH